MIAGFLTKFKEYDIIKKKVHKFNYRANQIYMIVQTTNLYNQPTNTLSFSIKSLTLGEI